MRGPEHIGAWHSSVEGLISSAGNPKRVTLYSDKSAKLWSNIMSSEYWVEEDTCELCGGPVAVYMKRDYAWGSHPLQPIAQRALCLKGCVGQVISPSRMMDRGA